MAWPAWILLDPINYSQLQLLVRSLLSEDVHKQCQMWLLHRSTSAFWSSSGLRPSRTVLGNPAMADSAVLCSTHACCVAALPVHPQVSADEVQLVLQGAAAGGRNLTYRSTGNTSNCSSWEFSVQPNATAQPGSFAAHLVLPKQRVSLRLPQAITLDVPLRLSMRSPAVNASADTSAFAVRVQLNAPAGPGGVTVRLQLMNDAGAVRVRLQETGCLGKAVAVAFCV
jgi:hypothetical protein